MNEVATALAPFVGLYTLMIAVSLFLMLFVPVRSRRTPDEVVVFSVFWPVTLPWFIADVLSYHTSAGETHD